MNFNSIKVRLERINPNLAIAQISGFQFHKGTIRTNLVREQVRTQVHFNSIKVRLEQSTFAAIKAAWQISIP